jgi:hypothetical protein
MAKGYHSLRGAQCGQTSLSPMRYSFVPGSADRPGEDSHGGGFVYCSSCGSQLPDGAKFCATCGAAVNAGLVPPPPPDYPVDAPVDLPADQTADDRAPEYQPTLAQPTEIRPAQQAPPARGLVPPPVSSQPRPVVYQTQPDPLGYAPPPVPPVYGRRPRRSSRVALWVGIAAAVVVLATAGVVAWRLVVRGDNSATSTTVAAQTTTTKPTSTSTTATTEAPTPTSTSNSPSTTSALLNTAPGDSMGQWAEMNIPEAPRGVYAAVVSDQALLLDVEQGQGYALYVYTFDTQSYLQLPIEASDFFGEDIDGNMVVWWEGDYDQATGEYSNEHIYAYALPNGPKVEVAGNRGALLYPQVSGSWVTWVQSETFAESPDDYSLYHVYGVTIDSKGNPQGQPIELVSDATAYVQGDAGWTYSLSGDHLAWENATTVGVFEPGVYQMSLTSRQPTLVGSEVWRPSLGDDKLVFTESGLMITGADGGAVTTLDPAGDFASAASTFAAYFRSVDGPDGTTYQIVARGFTGTYEQVLGEQTDAPWLSAPISASDRHVACVIDGTAHVFEWTGPKTY